MITKFKQFNEGINHLLVGPTDEEIWEDIKKLKPNEMFIISCRSGILKGIEMALEMGVNINIDDSDSEDYDYEEGYEGSEFGINILIENNHIGILKYLLEKYSKVMQLEDFLEYSVINNNINAVKLLVEHGADINDENYSILPLGVTSNRYNSHYGIIEYLLENGADKHIHNDFCINFAKKHNDIEIIELLNRFK